MEPESILFFPDEYLQYTYLREKNVVESQFGLKWLFHNLPDPYKEFQTYCFWEASFSNLCGYMHSLASLKSLPNIWH